MPTPSRIRITRDVHPKGAVVKDGLPAGWWLWVQPGPLGIGWRVSAYFTLAEAPAHIREEAAALGVPADRDPEVFRIWRFDRDKALAAARPGHHGVRGYPDRGMAVNRARAIIGAALIFGVLLAVTHGLRFSLGWQLTVFTVTAVPLLVTWWAVAGGGSVGGTARTVTDAHLADVPS